MSKINRFSGNFQAFGINAVAGERTVFNDQATESNTLDDNMTSDFLRGLGINAVGTKPIRESINGIFFTLGQALAYLHQMGIGEYNASQEYYNGSHCIGSDNQLYRSVSSPNTGNDPTIDDGSNWVNDLSEANDYTDTQVASEASARSSADSSEASTRAAADSAHAALTNPHSATTSADADRICLRDGSGRISVGEASTNYQATRRGQFNLDIGSGYGRLVLPVHDGREFTLQWKSVSLPNNAVLSHTFQYTFSNECLGVWVCRSSNFDDYNEESGVAAYGYTTSGCSVSSQMATSGMVFAIGY